MTRTSQAHLKELVLPYSRSDYPRLKAHHTIGEALRRLRREGVGERIIYFYVTDDDGRLVGIIPTRRLFMSESDVPLEEIMVKDVVAIRGDATVLEASELFMQRRLLALPVVDTERRLLGVVDVGLLTQEALEAVERHKTEDVFQLIGVRLAQIKNRSALDVFRFRFPWLLATMASGIACAALANLYEATLAATITLAFFLALVLGLGESVSIQSMTVTLQRLHGGQIRWREYARLLRGEVATAFLLGAASGTLVALIAWGWHGDVWAAVVIGTSIMLSIVTACTLGLSIPVLLHAVHEESKIAAGPITLALADIATLLFYFNAARLIL